MIASLHDENNHITIPGFYDKVEELSWRKSRNGQSAFSRKNIKALDLNDVYGEKDN
jgi:hypothetical protein